ncbi:hypothetical protein AVEN_153586-1 [Araneus ventricosus]|uniref:Uncharacterized protein n=1 Tax=Araneus ventricosus TaxID=182803 RepID=A0A4Y2BNN2_ARAVE|nr:hypothetical protein AVEN_153586-1 [Araneus ventricosus]
MHICFGWHSQIVMRHNAEENRKEGRNIDFQGFAVNLRNVWFQHDGAPHGIQVSKSTIRHIPATSHRIWWLRRMPPRSPDLNPLDFSVGIHQSRR